MHHFNINPMKKINIHKFCIEFRKVQTLHKERRFSVEEDRSGAEYMVFTLALALSGEKCQHILSTLHSVGDVLIRELLTDLLKRPLNGPVGLVQFKS
jgi:hypothetical protein